MECRTPRKNPELVSELTNAAGIAPTGLAIIVEKTQDGYIKHPILFKIVGCHATMRSISARGLARSASYKVSIISLGHGVNTVSDRPNAASGSGKAHLIMASCHTPE